MAQERRVAQHASGSETVDVVRGLVQRLRIPWLLRHHARRPVIVAFSFLNGVLSIALLAVVALLTGTPFIFPSLGPTAFLFFHTPTAPPTSPRNTILGHTIGVVAGYLSLVVTGLTLSPPTLTAGVSWPRVIAASLSLGLTAGAMVLFNAAHPPARATTMIISLGLMTRPTPLAILLLAVVVLTAAAFVLNRLAGIDYPLWSAKRQQPAFLPATPEPSVQQGAS